MVRTGRLAILTITTAVGRQDACLPAPRADTIGASSKRLAHTQRNRFGMGHKEKRYAFFFALIRQIHVIWPILSGVLAIMVGLGLLIGFIEDWQIGEALYFTFVTGLTIGYGDFTPKHLSSRMLAVIIGFAGIVLTGLVAAISVQALRATGIDPKDKSNTEK